MIEWQYTLVECAFRVDYKVVSKQQYNNKVILTNTNQQQYNCVNQFTARFWNPLHPHPQTFSLISVYHFPHTQSDFSLFACAQHQHSANFLLKKLFSTPYTDFYTISKPNEQKVHFRYAGIRVCVDRGAPLFRHGRTNRRKFSPFTNCKQEQLGREKFLLLWHNEKHIRLTTIQNGSGEEGLM